MYYVVLRRSGYVTVNEIEPLADDSEIEFSVACETIGHAYAVQAIAIRAKHIGAIETGERAALQLTIQTQSSIIRDNNLRIATLEDGIAKERTKTHDREVVLRNVMSALALDMALERTHQQRNVGMRHIVRLIKRILDNVDLDIDDIPF